MQGWNRFRRIQESDSHTAFVLRLGVVESKADNEIVPGGCFVRGLLPRPSKVQGTLYWPNSEMFLALQTGPGLGQFCGELLNTPLVHLVDLDRSSQN
jgi:hypothetical protein